MMMMMKTKKLMSCFEFPRQKHRRDKKWLGKVSFARHVLLIKTKYYSKQIYRNVLDENTTPPSFLKFAAAAYANYPCTSFKKPLA